MQRKTIKKMEGGLVAAARARARARAARAARAREKQAQEEAQEEAQAKTPAPAQEQEKKGSWFGIFGPATPAKPAQTSAPANTPAKPAKPAAALPPAATALQAAPAAANTPAEAQSTAPATTPPQALAQSTPPPALAPAATTPAAKAPATTPPPELAPAAIEAKKKFSELKTNLQEQKDGCIAYYNITNCKQLPYSDDKDKNDMVIKRFERINALLKDSLLTLVNQNNKLKLADNEIKDKNLEDLFKNLLYSFIEYLINEINNTTGIKIYVENIDKQTTITDQNYNNGVMLVKKYIDSYYSKGIAILTDKDDVKYYKYDNDTYTVNTTITSDNKDLTKFFILRIIDKKIMIHQIFQQIISGLIDTITKDDEIFNKYYSLR